MGYFARFENVTTQDEHPAESLLVGPFEEFLQLTYTLLRSGPNGDDLADLILTGQHAGCWHYNGNYYSDVVLYAD